MKRIMIAATLLVLLLGTAVSAQAPARPWVLVSHRIYAEAHPWIYEAAYAEFLKQIDSPFFAAGYAAAQVSFDAQQRVAFAMEAFRWKDPVFFKQVMESYGLAFSDVR